MSWNMFHTLTHALKRTMRVWWHRSHIRACTHIRYKETISKWFTEIDGRCDWYCLRFFWKFFSASVFASEDPEAWNSVCVYVWWKQIVSFPFNFSKTKQSTEEAPRISLSFFSTGLCQWWIYWTQGQYDEGIGRVKDKRRSKVYMNFIYDIFIYDIFI